MKQKISDLMDGFVGFMDYGVRAWLFAFVGYSIMAGLGYFHIISQITGLFAIMGVLWITSIIWTYDFARGYVPVWWLRLGYGKKAKARMILKNKR